MRIEINRKCLLATMLATVLVVGCGQTSGEESTADDASQAPPLASDPAQRRGLMDTVKAMIAEPELILPEGTVLTARLIPALSTETHAVGDSFDATLAESLIAGGEVVAPAGSSLTGVVVEADKGGRVDGRARIGVQLTELRTAGDRRIEISTDAVARTAPATKTKDAQKIGIGAGVGAAIGAIAGGGKGAAIGAAAGGGAGTGAVLATRGAPAEIPSETVLSFRLRHAVKIP